MMQLGQKNTDLDRYIYLMNLLDHNETLFYRTVMSDPARFLPIVYDPTIAKLSEIWAYLPPGAWHVSLDDAPRQSKGRPQKTAAERRSVHLRHGWRRILGLGDLGANGAGIPIGKLQLYTACAGVPPQYLLPMYVDAGTNNEQYLNDPLYLGMRKTRPATRIFIRLSTSSSKQSRKCFRSVAFTSKIGRARTPCICLERYRDKYCVYNDDVQGTAGITLAGMINAANSKAQN